MKHVFEADEWHEHDRKLLGPWIPFVGPLAAVTLLSLIYVILAEVLQYLPK